LTSADPSMTIVELAGLLSTGATTPRELLQLRKKTIRQYNGRLNAFINIFGEDPVRRSRRRKYLDGITIAVKDNVYIKGHRTTAGSKILKNFVPTFDADVVTRLKAAGAVILGKTNLHEFAFGVTNINPHYGDCRNPWSIDRVSGGSSGGSAVAVAQGMTCAAVGTDTAGSVRIPASLCGVVGFKPTKGLISTRGTIPLAWSLDTIGFLTRSVADAALLTRLAAKGDVLPRGILPARLRGSKIGVPQNILTDVDEDVMRRFNEALAMIEGRGATLARFDFPHYGEAIACRGLITLAEVASYHQRYFQERYHEYGSDLRKRLAQGLVIPAAAYIDAQRARRTLIDRYRSLFGRLDMIALPTTPIAAPTIKASKDEASAPKIRRALLAFTEPFNVYGAPAISIPCGLTRQDLPVGLQLVGDLNSDSQLLSFALSLERELPRIPRKPPFEN
jgi:aspartyl-tRNA(Asn)/glutamyl-tRNA(Gln) amidotransferase subunit A